MQRAGSDSESEEREEEYQLPLTAQPSKKRYNVNHKIFVCSCGKDFSYKKSLAVHLKKRSEHSQEKKEQILKASPNNPNVEEVENGMQVTARDVPTFKEEADQIDISDKAYNLICALWRTLPPLTYGSVDDVIFKRQKYKVESGDSTYEDVINSRKKTLNSCVQEILELRSLEDLKRLVGSNNEFRNYRLKDGEFEAKYKLNFAWDLAQHFEPSFAAKIQIFLYAICCKNMLDLNNMEGWRNFKANQWAKYSFIEPILEQYHQEWRGRQKYIQYV